MHQDPKLITYKDPTEEMPTWVFQVAHRRGETTDPYQSTEV